MRDRLPGYDVLESGATLTLVGAPGRIRHELDFHNGGDQRAILRLATFSSPQIEEATGRRPGVLMPTVVLHPGQARRAPINISIPSHTPPGRYEGELVVAGQAIAVVVHVVEEYHLDIAPAEVILENRAGDRTVRQIVCSNLGNVPVMISDIGKVLLDDDLTNCRIMRGITVAWPEEGGEHEAIDRFVDLYVQEGRKVVEHSGALRVQVVGGPRELSPGATEVVDLEITLPDELDPRTRYTAFTLFSTTDLTFRVVPLRGRSDELQAATPAKAVRARSRAAPAKSARTTKSAPRTPRRSHP